VRRITVLSVILTLLTFGAVTAAAQTVSPPTGVVNTAALNLRTAPDRFAPILRQMPGGTQALIIGENENESWFQLQLPDGTVGWASSEFIIIRGYAAEVPEVVTAPVPQPEGLGLVRAIRLNVRATPDPLATVLRVAVAGERVTLLSTNGDASWYLVQFEDGFQGWVYSEWINLYYGDAEFAPSVDVPETALPSRTFSNGLVNQPRLNVRPAPDPNSTPLTSIGFQTRVTIIGRTADTRWLQVTANGVTGWVYAEFINPNVGNFENAPVTF